MSTKTHKIAILTAFFAFAFFFIFLLAAKAEEIDPNAVASRRQQLEEELTQLESQIEAYRSTIEEKQREATTLERDISILDAEINKAKLEIKARDLSIATLAEGINTRTRLIGALVLKIEEERASMAELIRRINELDSTSLAEVVLAYQNLSEFFSDVDNFDSIQEAVQASYEEIQNTKISTEKEREELETKKSEEMELRYLQALEKKRREEAEANKKDLLKITKGKEKEYQKIMASRQKDAATIRSQLFMLRGSAAISFEKALEYANAVSKITGIRPAFLLGVIAEESNLGANVGTGNWKNELSHSRCTNQRNAFAELTASLGLDPDLMPVSKRAWYGYCGGAMGPAQFIPTTWQLYSDRISKITGHNPANPWDAFDAFAAASLLLKDNGAVSGNYTSERTAALKYLAGSNWKKSAYAFYGDDVMALAAKYQEMINILQGN
jgi:hypothetical protein